MTILLDSGHNERTAGKQSPDGTIKEWEYTYRLVEAVRNQLLMKSGINAYHLDADPACNGRDDKEELRWRVKLANSICDAAKQVGEETIVVSVHLDAFSSDTPRGATVFIAPNASSKSKTLGNIFAESIPPQMKGNRAEQLRVGNYAIVRDTKCPAVLIECAFMTNPHDQAFLKSDEGFATIRNWIVGCLTSTH